MKSKAIIGIIHAFNKFINFISCSILIFATFIVSRVYDIQVGVSKIILITMIIMNVHVYIKFIPFYAKELGQVYNLLQRIEDFLLAK